MSNNGPFDKVFGPRLFPPRNLTAAGGLEEILENEKGDEKYFEKV